MECLSITWIWALFFLVIFTVHDGTDGCLDKERSALLHLKASINHPNLGTSLSSWEEGTDCCSWERVKCNSHTGRVIELSLESIRWYYDVTGDWYLNASLLLPFQELKSLDLSQNYLAGLIEGKALRSGSTTLGTLEILRLSYNSLSNSERILPYLRAFPTLRKLHLEGNFLSAFSYDGVQSLSRLRKLEELDLSFNYFNETILPYVAALKSLKYLDLGYNKFHNDPSNIESFTSLIALSLPGCTLNDSQSIQGICKLKTLKELDLTGNKFEGPFPSCLGNLADLRLLELSDNRFSGNVPTTTIKSLTSLVYFSLSRNHFSGLLPLSTFANLSKLEKIDLSNNELEVDTGCVPWVPTFKLKFIGLSNCGINKITNGNIPKFLYNQSDLRIVDLSNNHIHGKLPKNIGNYFPNLLFLNMFGNALHGSIPPSIGNMKSLYSLDLSYNNLSGEIPGNLTGCIQLRSLKLSNNRLHGEIFPAYFNLTWLSYLHLDNNQFTGIIQPSLFNSFNLQVLDIGYNCMSGRIPSQIGELSSLEQLILRENHFEGSIPFELCKLSQLFSLHLSKNTLSGSIPSFYNSSSLMYIHLENNHFSGVIPRALLENLVSLVTLDISYNNISGGIPRCIGKPSNLRALLLKGNRLQGRIPNELCQLEKLQILDLSCNYLSNSVPKCISNSAFGKDVVVDAFDHQSVNIDFALNDVEYSYKFHLFKVPLSHLEEDYQDVVPQQVEFVTKSRSDSYKGVVLRYMSVIDLSCNRFSGEIPHEIGQLNRLHALNLSYNILKGSIPKTFSNLSEIESIDLSHNNLSGAIPFQLVELSFLSVFKVGYNNLSGPIPETRQFFTFEEDSFTGNPLLCGPQVKRNCSTSTHPTIQRRKEENTRDNGIISFYASFLGSYFVFFLGTIIVLYFNTQSLDVCLSYIVNSCTFVMCTLRRIFCYQ